SRGCGDRYRIYQFVLLPDPVRLHDRRNRSKQTRRPGGISMKRRTFLKRSVGASLVLGGLPHIARLAEATEGRWRSFEVVTRLDVVDTDGTTRAWVPVPLTTDTDYFRRQGADSWKGDAPGARLYRDDKYDAGFVYAEWPASEKAPVIEVTSRFSTRDRF